MKKYETRYCVKDPACPARVEVRETTQQGRGGAVHRVYRDRFGVTYAAHHIRAWDNLTAAQKAALVVSEYKQELEGIEWAIAKDPTLTDMREPWEKAARDKRDAALVKYE